MKQVAGWFWPDGEQHMIEWMADTKNRIMLNGRSSYQGKKQIRTLERCPLSRRRTMIDAGAHIGLWSYNFAPHFKRIEAFEPVQTHRDCFAKNVTADNVVLHPYALGSNSDLVHIRVNPSSTGDSWVQGKGEIQMHPIDRFEFADVDLIKVDAEGYEEFILTGAEKTIVTWCPVIIVEQKRDMAVKFGLQPQGAIKYLNGLGYKVADEIGGDFILMPARGVL